MALFSKTLNIPQFLLKLMEIGALSTSEKEAYLKTYLAA